MPDMGGVGFDDDDGGDGGNVFNDVSTRIFCLTVV